MRLVTFASAIAFGLVAGLSQAGDWNGVQVAMLDRSGPDYGPRTPLAVSNSWRVSQQRGPDIKRSTAQVGSRDSAGITLAITDPAEFWGWGLEATPLNRQSANDHRLRPTFQNGIGSILGAENGNFLMNVSFRF